MRVAIIGLLFLLMFSCQRADKNKNVFTLLDKEFESSVKAEFKESSSENFVDFFLDSFQNEIGKLIESDVETSALFDKYEISSFYDRKRLVVYFWHQKLNSIRFDFEEHLKSIYKREKKLEDKIRLKNELIDVTFLGYDVGTNIFVKFQLLEEFGVKQVVLYSFPLNSWEYNRNMDLEIEATLISKNNKGKYFKMKITKMNQDDVVYLGKKIAVNEEFEFDLSLFPYKINELN